jgi:hypothetical protein
LHTWGQKLDLHPHLHCVVPGGGISLDGSRWVPCPRGFFMPVKLLSRMFRGTFLALLKAAHGRGELVCKDSCNPWSHTLPLTRGCHPCTPRSGRLRPALERPRARPEIPGIHPSRGGANSRLNRSTTARSPSLTRTIGTNIDNAR